MNQHAAVQHLRTACVPVDKSDAALIVEWQAAQATLGAPIPSAGLPDIQPIPAADQVYIQRFQQEPWVASAFRLAALQGSTFQLIEIEPLLPLQMHIDTDRSDHHCSSLSNPPTIAELLPVCLPITQPDEETMMTPIGPNSQSVMIKTRNLAIQMIAAGVFHMDIAGYKTFIGGAQFHLSVPFLQVVRLNGRCYLHNGLHRAYGIRRAGATHMPCLLRDVATAEGAGIKTDGSTFSEALLTSANPPTVAHFTQWRARNVQLRRISRNIIVTWARYVLPDE
jgi:hypothetical protein